jgi:hypothetical protein
MASANESTNPWEVTVTEETVPARVGDRQPVAIGFQGELDALRIQQFYRNPYQFGCLVPLVLVSALVWGVPFYMITGVIGAMFVAVVALVVILGMYSKLLGTARVSKILRERPWLIGPLHGVVSGGRLTVWHNDFCLQTTARSYMDEPGRGMLVYPTPAAAVPWAMVPSVCFYEQQWLELLDDYINNRRYQMLIGEAPPEGAWVSLLSQARSVALAERYHTLHWRPSSSLFLVTMVATSWYFLVEPTFMRGWTAIYGLLPVLFWGFLELVRFARARYLSEVDFREGSGAYRRSIKTRGRNGSERELPCPELRWFTSDVVFVSDFQHWMRIPMRYIRSVKVESTFITFRMLGNTMVFHREGFLDDAHWRGACEEARRIAAERKGNG